MDIIPAIDIIDGKCVRLTEGDYKQKTVYHENPVEIAKQFEDNGISRLHLVDLDGAKAKKVINLSILERIANGTSLLIDFGGGVRTSEDLRMVFDAGANEVTGGSVAVKNPTLFESWLEEFGPNRIILGADVKDGQVAISGWQEHTEWQLLDYVGHFAQKGVQRIICTDISKDGLLKGPAIDLYHQLTRNFPGLSIIASGGVSKLEDLVELRGTGVAGVIVGKAIYEGKITLEELSNF
jgi:phosphoribosylformimino-5-aminoimidazole carboxamide ribotide isomerase